MLALLLSLALAFPMENELQAFAAADTRVTPGVQFGRLTNEDGLAQGPFTDFAQDRTGFLWIATSDGLQRYDGRRFTSLKAIPGRRDALNDNTITGLFMERGEILWVGTWTGGLSRVDTRTGQIQTFRHDPKLPTSLSSDSIGALYVDKAGVLWVGTLGGGLNRFDAASGVFGHYVENPSRRGQLPSNYVLALAQDQAGTLWVGTEGGGLSAFDPAKERFVVRRHDPTDPESLSHDTVTSILEDDHGALWVGTSAGLAVLDAEREKFRRYAHDPADSSSLGDNHIMALHQDGRGKLWIGTEYGGINVLDPETQQFTRHTYDAADPHSYLDSMVYVIFEDAEGTLWFGSDHGLAKLDPTRLAFTTYRNSCGRPSVASTHARGFQEMADGALWIGSEAGLDRIDPKSGHVRHYPIREVRSFWVHPDAQGLDDGAVVNTSSSASYQPGRYAWIGAAEQGLLRLDLQSGRTKSFPYDPDGAPEAPLGATIQDIVPGPDGKLWLGYWGQGLSRFDPQRERFKHVPYDLAESSLPSGFIPAMLVSRDGKRLFIATLNAGRHRGGLAILDLSTLEIEAYSHDPAAVGSLSSDMVFALYEDRRGALWVGTGSGLSRLAPAAQRFETFTMQHGLAGDVIYGVLEDEAGTLWLGTSRGLSNFDPQTGRAVTYTTADGLPHNEFIQSASARGRETMYFGTLGGALVFDPKRVVRNTRPPPIVLTSFTKLGKPVELDRPLNQIEEIELTYRDYALGFNFVALSFRAPHLNRYAYKLEGFDPDWSEARADGFASYTNLQGGEYVFRVRASNHHGVWNEQGPALKLRVHPPPWRTWWANTAYALGAVFALASYVVWQKRRHATELARQAQLAEQLQREVERRTQELSQRTAEALSSKDQAEKALAAQQLAEARLIQSEKMSSLGRLVAGVAHEFNNPLNFVQANFSVIKKTLFAVLPDEPETRELQQAFREEFGRIETSTAHHELGTQRLSSVVQSLKSFSRHGEAEMKPADVNRIIEDTLVILRWQLREVTVDKDLSPLPEILCNPSSLGQVFLNVIDNALYAAGQTRRPEGPRVRVCTRQVGGSVVMEIGDNGPGIDPAVLPRIFDPFVTTKPVGVGTGLGLSIGYSIIREHGGEILAANADGALFTITLPVRPAASEQAANGISSTAEASPTKAIP